MKADLHIHSDLSDCSVTREDIIKLAVRENLSHISFTEHDSTFACDEGVKLGEAYGIQAIRGIEISAFDFETGKKAHILGFGYKDTDILEKLCAPTLRKRHENCLKQIKILRDLGYQIQTEDVLPYTKSVIYKQHILQYLVDTNQTDALFGDIYKDIFKNEGPCDFDITYVSAEDAVTAIVDSGGVAVLAHPGQQKNFDLIPRLLTRGLQGIERNHPSHSTEDIVTIDTLAQQYNLLFTGGSDFHGVYESKKSDVGQFVCPMEKSILQLL